MADGSNLLSPRYRLLFLDLDGTLVGHDLLPSSRTLTALHRAREQGCTLVVCTGRHRHTAEPITTHWSGGSVGYGVYCNGAIIVEHDTGRTVHKRGLPSNIVRRAAFIAYTFGLAPLCYGVHVEEDGGKAVYADRRYSPHPDYLRENAYRLVYCATDIESEADTLAPVDMAVYGEEAPVRALASAWRQELGADVMVYDAPERCYNACWSAFLHDRRVNKAHAAQWVADRLGVPREQTMAVGDQRNDLELLRWAGLGVCMGDGHEDARACAAHITGPLAEDGAAQAIEQFLL